MDANNYLIINTKNNSKALLAKLQELGEGNAKVYLLFDGVLCAPDLNIPYMLCKASAERRNLDISSSNTIGELFESCNTVDKVITI